MWKGGQNNPFPTWNSAVPKNSRPAINGPNNGPVVDPQQFAAPFGRPRPLKVWRKQLGPAPHSGKGAVSVDQINAPGGSVFTGDISGCIACHSCTLQYTTQTVRVPEIIILNGNPDEENGILFNITDPYFVGRTLKITGSELGGTVILNFPTSASLGKYVYYQYFDVNPPGIYQPANWPTTVIPPVQNPIGSATFLGTVTTFTEIGGDFNWSFTNPWTIVNGGQGNSDTGLSTAWDTSGATPLENLVNFSTPNQYKYTEVKIFEDYTCSNGHSSFIKSSIYGNFSYLTPETPNEIYEGTYYTDIAKNEYEKCISCDPESNIIKPGMVQHIQNNYTDFNAYLQSRCSTILQNSDTEKIKGNTYILPQGDGAWPSDSTKGAQQFNMPTCATNCTIGKTIPTIYKPNNRPFARQGGVSASTRTFALKQNTCTDYNNSGLSANGLKEINYGRFTETPITPYYLKTQFNFCKRRLYWRKGNPTACWYTPVSDMYHQSLKTTKVYPVTYCQKNITIYNNSDCNFYFIGPNNNVQTDCFKVDQNTILTTVTSAFFTSTTHGGSITAFLYNCDDTNSPILASDTIEIPSSSEEGAQYLIFTFNSQDIYDQPSNDKNFVIYPGINYCIKFIASTDYRYQKCFKTNCIVVDVEGYYYTKYC